MSNNLWKFCGSQKNSHNSNEFILTFFFLTIQPYEIFVEPVTQHVAKNSYPSQARWMWISYVKITTKRARHLLGPFNPHLTSRTAQPNLKSRPNSCIKEPIVGSKGPSLCLLELFKEGLFSLLGKRAKEQKMACIWPISRGGCFNLTQVMRGIVV